MDSYQSHAYQKFYCKILTILYNFLNEPTMSIEENTGAQLVRVENMQDWLQVEEEWKPLTTTRGVTRRWTCLGMFPDATIQSGLVMTLTTFSLHMCTPILNKYTGMKLSLNQTNNKNYREQYMYVKSESERLLPDQLPLHHITLNFIYLNAIL